ncbi:MAG: septal ring lytic transglycosylase RlpA family protein [Pseudomonadota bacterium]
MLLVGCAGTRPPASSNGGDVGWRMNPPSASSSINVPPLPAAGSGRGGYYQDDGPGEAPPSDLQAIPDATPQIEPYGKRGNRPYVVFGKTYTPFTDDRPLKQRGIGSWYGKKFHGQKTSSGELYDMYKMTAAHPTMPLPSYARVTNVANGAQVIVRVNDRGPFHSGRIIDLSYTAALKLGYLSRGSSELEVERLLPDEIARINSGQQGSVTRMAGSLTSIPSSAKPITQSNNAPVSLPVSLLPSSNPLPNSPPSSAPSAAVPGLSPSSTMAAVSVVTTPVASSLEDFLASQPDSAVPTLPGGFYLQFGAFSQIANADTMRERLMQAWPPTLPTLSTQPNGAVFRLVSGPFATRDDALRAAALLADGSLEKPLIVQP